MRQGRNMERRPGDSEEGNESQQGENLPNGKAKAIQTKQSGAADASHSSATGRSASPANNPPPKKRRRPPNQSIARTNPAQRSSIWRNKIRKEDPGAAPLSSRAPPGPARIHGISDLRPRLFLLPTRSSGPCSTAHCHEGTTETGPAPMMVTV